MFQSNTLFIGMDVHKESIAVAYVAQEHGAEVPYLGTIGTRHAGLDKRIRAMQSKAKQLIFVYQAGSCGRGEQPLRANASQRSARLLVRPRYPAAQLCSSSRSSSSVAFRWVIASRGFRPVASTVVMASMGSKPLAATSHAARTWPVRPFPLQQCTTTGCFETSLSRRKGTILP
jgi:hypothetical protein